MCLHSLKPVKHLFLPCSRSQFSAVMEPALTEQRYNISLSTRFRLVLKFYKPHPSFVKMLPYPNVTKSMSE